MKCADRNRVSVWILRAVVVGLVVSLSLSWTDLESRDHWGRYSSSFFSGRNFLMVGELSSLMSAFREHVCRVEEIVEVGFFARLLVVRVLPGGGLRSR